MHVSSRRLQFDWMTFEIAVIFMSQGIKLTLFHNLRKPVECVHFGTCILQVYTRMCMHMRKALID